DTTGTNAPNDQSVWVGSLSGGTPTLFATVAGTNFPLGLELETAPTLAANFASTPTYVETAGVNSGQGTAVQPGTSYDAADFDSGNLTDQLAGAQVRISVGFGSSPGTTELLSINGTTSGVLNYGSKTIAYNYNSGTGVMSLTGVATLDNYESALALVGFSISGDNPDNYGANGTRTVSYSLFDGLLRSDENDVLVTVGAVNDAPVNVVGGAVAASEDVPVAITGLSVSDVDANPSADVISVTLSVGHGGT